MMSMKSAKTFVYSQIFEHKDKNDTYDYILFSVIILNLLLMTIETLPRLSINTQHILQIVDELSTVFFIIDYTLRVWCCTVSERFNSRFIGRLKYIFSFGGLLDLMCLVSIKSIPINNDLFRVVRLLRLFRVFKALKHVQGFTAIENTLIKNRQALVSSFMFIFIAVFTLSSVVYYCENGAQPDKFTSIPHSLWWGIITLTSVGYGDMFPITTAGKIVTCILSLLAIPLTAIPGSIIFSGMVEELKKK